MATITTSNGRAIPVDTILEINRKINHISEHSLNAFQFFYQKIVNPHHQPNDDLLKWKLENLGLVDLNGNVDEITTLVARHKFANYPLYFYLPPPSLNAHPINSHCWALAAAVVVALGIGVEYMNGAFSS